MNPKVYDLAKSFFGFGDDPENIIIVFPGFKSTRRRTLKCSNYPPFKYEVSPDDVYSGLRVYSLLSKFYAPDKLKIDFTWKLDRKPDSDRVLIGGPPTNKFVREATKNCPTSFGPDEEVRFLLGRNSRRYEIDFEGIGHKKKLIDDYCLLSKKVINDSVEFVIAGLRAYGQVGVLSFLGDENFYRQLTEILNTENFQVLVKVRVDDNTVTNWEIVDFYSMPAPGGYLFDIFLSYSRTDANKVRTLTKRLKQLGFSVWLDIEQMHGGGFVLHQIGEGLKNSKYVLPCLSPNYKSSRWTHMEFETLLHRQIEAGSIRVIPVEISQCSDEDIPDLLRNIIRLPLHRRGGFQKLIRQLGR